MSTIAMRRAAQAVAVLAFLATLFFSPAAVAQVATGSMVGTIVDASGQIVPGAQVTIRDVNRNTTTPLVTDATGVYTAPFLVPGTYEVSVELQGFKTWTRRGLVLQVNDRLRIDATLEVGTLTESTTVTGEAPLVRTDSSEVGTVIEEMAIRGAAAERPQLRGARLSRARGLRPGQAGENLSGASTFNPRGGVELQRARQSGQLERLARRRHRQQRVHVQHRHRLAVGRAGPRVQGAVRSVLRRVRPRRRRGVGVDQVGHQPAARHGLRVPAQRRVRCPQLLRAQGRGAGRVARQGSGAAARPPPVRRRARRRRWSSPGCTTATAGRSSSPITPVSRRSAA